MPFLVPNLLELTIPLNDGRMLFAIPSPVVRVAGAPLLRTIQAFLPVNRVHSDLLAVIIGAATPLALGLTANQLPRLILRWLENHLTVAATPFDHSGVVASTADGFQLEDLETAVECVPHPGRKLGRTAASEGGGGVLLLENRAWSERWFLAASNHAGFFGVLAILQDPLDYSTGGIAVVLYRHQHLTFFRVVAWR